MSLKNIGKIISAGTDFIKLIKAVNEIGDLEKAVKALNSVEGINNDLKSAVLVASDLKVVNDEAAKAALGITSVGTASTTASAGVASLGATLKAAFVAHPILMMATAIAGVTLAVTGAVSAWNNYRDSQLKAAKEIAQSVTEQNAAIADQKTKIQELKTSLDQGTLSESEAYDAKSQLFDIQQQLIGQYGSSAAGIDSAQI